MFLLPGPPCHDRLYPFLNYKSIYPLPSGKKQNLTLPCVAQKYTMREEGDGRPQTPITLVLPLKGQHLAIFLKPTSLSYTS